MSPTRTYAPIIVALLKDKEIKKGIKGIVHCSGGAQTKILHFISRGKVVKDNLFPIPPLFEMIRNESKTEWKEMYRVVSLRKKFNVIFPYSI